MIIDFVSALVGILVAASFVLPIGYAVGHFSNLGSFRSQAVMWRLAAATSFAIAILPITTYLVAHVSPLAVWGLIAAASVLGYETMYRTRGFAFLRSPQTYLCFGIAVAFVLLVIDLQVGDRTYFSVIARDYLKHIAVTNELSVRGIPPTNPFYNVGEAASLYYYYGWFQFCSLIDVAGGGIVGSRGAVFAGTAWSALALISTTVLVTSSFVAASDSTVKVGKRMWTVAALAVALLVVGGLDLIVYTAGAIAFSVMDVPLTMTDIEWWNEPVFLWITSVLTVPHHVAGLLAALTGFWVISLESDSAENTIWKPTISGIAFATSAFCSIWVALVAAFIGAIWAVTLLLQRDFVSLRRLIWMAVVAAIVVLPYALNLYTTGSEGDFPIGIRPRPFGPLMVLGMDSQGLSGLVHLVLLPLNYFLELGFIGVVFVLVVWHRRRTGYSYSSADRFLMVVIVTSIVVASFMRSTMMNNDLGFRGIMFAQFGMVVVIATEIAGGRLSGFLKGKKMLKTGLRLMLVCGVAATLANAAAFRFVPLLADSGVIPMPAMYSLDNNLGTRTTDLRKAYEWLAENTPEDALTQHNPWQDRSRTEGGLAFAAALYGNRSVVAYDNDLGVLFGVSKDEYRDVATEIGRVFGDPESTYAAEVASKFNIDAFVVSDKDPVWQVSTSWVWTQEPDFVADRARVFLNPADTF